MAARSELTIARVKGALTAAVEPPAALVAASAPVDDPADLFKANGFKRRQDWQLEAWDLYDAVGEFKFYVLWIAASCSRVRLIASEKDPDTGLPTGSVAEDNAEGQRFAQIVKNIAGGALGQAQLIRRTAELLKVPGELWTAVLMRPKPGDPKTVVAQWFALTREEIKPNPNGRGVVIVMPDGKEHLFDSSKGDGIFRTWNAHARIASEPDSPVRGCLGSLREIVRTDRKMENADTSRMSNNGILVIPSETSLPPVQAPRSAGKPGDPPAPEPPQVASTAMKLQNLILQVEQRGRLNPGSPESVSPIVVTAPGEHIKNIQHISFGKDLSETELKKRDKAIDRLAMGLDMSPERLKGLGDSNHWSSRGIADDDVQLHISPVMETICGAIYDNVLRNVLINEKIDPDKYVLWYDTSGLTVDPDKTDETKDAYLGNAITSEAFVRGLGLPEDSLYDFDTPEGVKVFLRDAITKDPALIMTPGMGALVNKLFPGMQGLEIPEKQAALPPPAGQAPAVVEVDPNAADGNEPDTEDTPPRARVASMGVASMGVADPVSLAVDWGSMRALDMAGKRRVKTNDRDQRDRLRDVEPHEYYRYMPPVTAAEVPSLIRGWDTGLDDVAHRYGLDADEIRAAVGQRARQYLTSPVVDAEVI